MLNITLFLYVCAYRKEKNEMKWVIRLLVLTVLIHGFPQVASASDEPVDLNGPCPNEGDWVIRYYSDSTASNPHYRCLPPCVLKERVIVFKDGMEYRGNLITCDSVTELPLEQSTGPSQTGGSSQTGSPSQTGSFSQQGCTDEEVTWIRRANLHNRNNDDPEWSPESIRSNKSYLCNGVFR